MTRRQSNQSEEAVSSAATGEISAQQQGDLQKQTSTQGELPHRSPDSQLPVKAALDKQFPQSTPPQKPAPNKARPAQPSRQQDIAAIDQADSEGMAQPQGLAPEKGTSAASAKKATVRSKRPS